MFFGKKPKKQKKNKFQLSATAPPLGCASLLCYLEFFGKSSENVENHHQKKNKIANPKGGVLADSVGVQSYFFFVFEVFAMFDVW